MKLISKTLLYYLLISLPLLTIAGFLSYYLISVELKDGIDEALQKERSHLEKTIRTSNDPLKLSLSELDHIYAASNELKGEMFSDTIIYDVVEKENIKYRIITSYFIHNGQNYKLQLAKATMEEEELLEGLLSTFAIIGVFLLAAFFVVNWLVSKTLWKPFYTTLHKLNKYELKNHSNIDFENSNIKEFNNLNIALNKMTDKMYSDFLQQKEFTENASHEMQTPLAVIKANTSLLMQSQNLKEEEMHQLQAIDDTTKKLASLNKALLLLAKIDNNQFKETNAIEMGYLTNKIVQHFEDLIDAKQISLENTIKTNLTVNMNAGLAEILLSNLFQNAIRHNFKGGKIKIEINDHKELIISNTGEPLKITEDELFIRFKKNETSKESLGLGLAIVKSICMLYSISIKHNYTNNMHTFILKFKN